MMLNKKQQALLIVLPVFAGLLLFSPRVHAAEDLIMFETTPLFSEANFAPGHAVTRWVKIKNEAGYARQAGLILFNLVDPDGLGDRIELGLSVGEDELFSRTLTELQNQQETALSVIGPGETIQFDLTATMSTTAGNDFQGLDLSFDLTFGLSEEERQEEVHVYGGGGGGVVIIPSNEPPKPATTDDPGKVAGESVENSNLPEEGPKLAPKPGQPAGFFIPRAQASDGSETEPVLTGQVAGLLNLNPTGDDGRQWWMFSWLWWLLFAMILVLAFWLLLFWRRKKKDDNQPPMQNPPSF